MYLLVSPERNMLSYKSHDRVSINSVAADVSDHILGITRLQRRTNIDLVFGIRRIFHWHGHCVSGLDAGRLECGDVQRHLRNLTMGRVVFPARHHCRTATVSFGIQTDTLSPVPVTQPRLNRTLFPQSPGHVRPHCIANPQSIVDHFSFDSCTRTCGSRLEHTS